MALSEPLETDNWKVKDGIYGEGDGFIGFIHQVVIDNYLNYHETPEDIELYFCGPPLMNKAVEEMGLDFGIPEENIRFDDFGIDRKSTRLNSSHVSISYAVFCFKKKTIYLNYLMI